MSLASTEPLFEQQWYLINTGQSGGTVGMDIRVEGAWTDYTGEGVRVVVIDSGVFPDHPDLAANYDASADHNFVTGADHATDAHGATSHGTTVSGFLGAPLNGVGTVGVAYDCSFTVYRNSEGDGPVDAAVERALEAAHQFDVSNNSYGYFKFDGPDGVLAAIEHAAAVGRDGLGTVSVFATGNSRHQVLLSSYSVPNNSPYQITVAGTDHDGRLAVFSSPGSNVFVAAPGAAIVGNDGNENPGFAEASGTSYSAPIVSGAAALMLQANPGLGYRDVHEILGYSAYDTGGAPLTKQDVYGLFFNAPAIPDGTRPAFAAVVERAAERITSYPWSTVDNGAVDWNGGGLTVSHDYGLGQIDARAATRLAETWQAEAKTAGNLSVVTADTADPVAISDADEAGVTQTVTVSQDIRVESAVLELTVTDGYAGDLQVELVSPQGTVSYLVYNPDFAVFNSLTTTDWVTDDTLAKGTFLDSGDTATLMTRQVYGESSLGDWTLHVTDTVTGTTGTLESWTLSLYGGEQSADDRYVYTDQYTALAAVDPARSVLADPDGGTDTINASAVSGDVAIDFGAGIGTIAGTAFAIAEGSAIENLYTGDGDDTLAGSSAANHLIGGRGDDRLSGGAGEDTIDGGRSIDLATFAGSRAGYALTWNEDGTLSVAGADGNDTLANVEVLGFDDGYTVAMAPVGLSALGFDPELYLAANPDVAAAGYTVDTAYTHYRLFGIGEGRAANAFFDTAFYLAHNPDVAVAGVNPLQHYAEFGWQEGRDPSAFFDASQYLADNPDVAAAGLNPLDHFLRLGIAEGRLSQAAADWVGV